MARAAFCAPFLAPDDRARLEQELARVLPGSTEQICQFADAAEEAVSYHRQLAVPAEDGRGRRTTQLERLAEAARTFAEAVKALDPDTRDLLEFNQARILGADEMPKYRQTLDAARWADVTGRAADRLLQQELAKAPRPGPRRVASVASLVADLATAYGAIFHEQPSAAREGVFARAIAIVFDIADVRDPQRAADRLEIGESRLAGILNNRTLPGEKPARGRKRRAGN